MTRGALDALARPSIADAIYSLARLQARAGGALIEPTWAFPVAFLRADDGSHHSRRPLGASRWGFARAHADARHDAQPAPTLSLHVITSSISYRQACKSSTSSFSLSYTCLPDSVSGNVDGAARAFPIPDVDAHRRSAMRNMIEVAPSRQGDEQEGAMTVRFTDIARY